jgi:hypothetical protein
VYRYAYATVKKSCKKFGVITTKLSTSIFESFSFKTEQINQSLKNISFIVPGAEEVAEPGASSNTTRVSQCLLFYYSGSDSVR